MTKEKPSVKKWSEDGCMTAALCSLMEHCRHGQHRRTSLFTCPCLLWLFTHLWKIFLKRLAYLLNHLFERGPLPFPSAPGYFYPHPSTSPCLHPSIPPWDFPVPICTLLVTLSTYLVPTECLCNQTYTYPVVRHSNDRLIMKLHHWELTNG